MSRRRAVEHRWVVAGGVRLHALAFAEGPPTLVCLHGVTSHAWSWAPFVEAIGPGERCLAIDLRGHGESQWSASGDYGTERLAGDVEAVLDDAGAANVTLVGASLGGLVGLVVAARRPDLVARLVVLDLPPATTKDPIDIPPRPGDFDSHEAVVAFEQARNPRADPSAWQLLAAHGTRPGDGGRLVSRHDPLLARRWDFRSEDHWHELEAIEGPILVVKATDSPVLPEEAAEQMLARARRGRLERLSGTGHAVHVDDPASLTRLVRAFVADSG